MFSFGHQIWGPWDSKREAVSVATATSTKVKYTLTELVAEATNIEGMEEDLGRDESAATAFEAVHW